MATRVGSTFEVSATDTIDAVLFIVVKMLSIDGLFWELAIVMYKSFARRNVSKYLEFAAHSTCFRFDFGFTLPTGAESLQPNTEMRQMKVKMRADSN